MAIDIKETFSKSIGKLGKNLSSLLDFGTAAKDPKSFILKKGFETLFSRGYGGGADMGLVDTMVTPPKFATGKSMGFYTPSKARSSGTMGMQAKAVDPDTLRNDWFMRLRRYYTTKKYYS